MNPDDVYERWIEGKRSEGPGPGFTDAVMAQVRRDAPSRRARSRWLAAAVWLLAGCAGLWRAAQILGPFLSH